MMQDKSAPTLNLCQSKITASKNLMTKDPFSSSLPRQSMWLQSQFWLNGFQISMYLCWKAHLIHLNWCLFSQLLVIEFYVPVKIYINNLIYDMYEMFIYFTVLWPPSLLLTLSLRPKITPKQMCLGNPLGPAGKEKGMSISDLKMFIMLRTFYIIFEI